LNYKVVDLVESYNFHMKFTSIRVQTKETQIFEKRLDPYRRGPRRQEVLEYRAPPTAVGHGVRCLTPPPRRQMYSFAKKNCGPYIFCKIEVKIM
jgi:hypothetical protein